MKQNLVAIVNKYAGRNQHNRKHPVEGTWKDIKDYVISKLNEKFHPDVSITKFGAHNFKRITRKKAREYAFQDTIYVFVGGDDSLDYGITELLKQKRKLNDYSFKVAHIPIGEGMAVKYALGLKNLEHTLQLIIDNIHAKIDLINFDNKRFGFYGGQGFFGHTVYERGKTSTSGMVGFIVPAIKAYTSSIFERYKRFLTHHLEEIISNIEVSSLLKSYKRFLTLKTDKKIQTVEEDCIGILFSKIPNIGVGLKLIPKAKINDGLIHIAIYGPLGIIKQYAAEEVYCNQDHTHYGGDYQGINPINIKVEKQAINMILDKEELERRKTLIV